MKPEISAATEFLSRIFLAHDNITKEKVCEFKEHLSVHLEERFRDHWHESCPTKGQAYRCIRVCPEEPLDPILEKVCSEVGINVGDFNLPFELTLWVDPTEVVCKFGDLKCSYHTVAKKDQTSGNLDNRTDNLDIEDLVENARDLYLKKQTVVIHPIHSSEMHIPNLYSEGSNGFTMAVRVNGSMHYNMSYSPPLGYDNSPRGKGKLSHAGHSKRGGGYHHYGRSSGGRDAYFTNGGGSHVSSLHYGYQHHRNHQHHYHGSSLASAYTNGYLNGYSEENGHGLEQQSTSPTKMSTLNGVPPHGGGSGNISQSSPTPEQIQQQVQHPPPIPPLIPHIQRAFSPPSADTSSFSPPHQPPSSSSSTSTTASTDSCNINGAGMGKPSSNGSNSKNQSSRSLGARTKQTSPVKETK